MANAGTLLIWAGMGHLFIGNAIIGVIEAVLIARCFRLRYALIAPYLILANYLSMAGGVACTIWSSSDSGFQNMILGAEPLYRLPLLVATMTVITFLLSVLIEWPFVRAAFLYDRKVEVADKGEVDEAEYHPRRIFGATVLAQCVSYALLAVYYLAVSGTGFIRHARVVQGVGFAANPHTAVYYMHEGRDYCIKLDGAAPVAVTRQQVYQVQSDCCERYRRKQELYDYYLGASSNGRKTFDLRSAPNEAWKISTDFWGTYGLQLRNERTDASFDLGLELPFVRWRSEYAVLLPGDQVIYQFGPQIVLFDIKSRRLAFIARGRRPVVVME